MKLKLVILFFSVWGLDFFIKSRFTAYSSPHSWGFLNFSYVENHGIIFGSLSELPGVLKNVFLCTMGIALVTGLPIIFSLYQFHSKKLTCGLTLVVSGILGNVTDRILNGFVVDYFSVSLLGVQSPFVNFADIVQWVGYAILFIGVYEEISYQQSTQEKRSSGWINRTYQVRFAFLFLVSNLALVTTFVAFGYTFLRYSLLEMHISDVKLQQFLNIYLWTSAVLLLLSALIVILIGKTVSHRIAGPTKAIQRYLEDSMQGKNYPLKLRETDHLRELEKPLSEINDVLTKK